MGRLFAVVLALVVAAPGWSETPGTIVVTGTGTVEAAPDMAVISLGVTTEAPDAARAMAANSEAMTRVLSQLSEAGIADRDLQTEALSISPRWSRMRPNDGSQPEITGFVATNSLSVRVRDLDRLGEVLDLSIRDGANTLGGLRFTLAESAALLDAARVAAVADGRRKAELMAEAAGVTLGPLVELREAGGMREPMPIARAEMAMADAVPVARGEVGLSASVTMTYAIAE